MFTIIDINKIKQEPYENEFNSESISTENCKVDNPNEDETKHRQKPEVVGKKIGHQSCCVINCKNTSRKSGCKFYKFPTAKWKINQRNQWIAAVRRQNVDGSPWVPKPYNCICSDHFIGGKKSEEELSPSYIPTIFPSIYKSSKVNESSAINRYKRVMNRRMKAKLPSTSNPEFSVIEPIGVTENPPVVSSKVDQKCQPEVIGEILAKDSNEMRYINVFDDIKNNKAQEENIIKEEFVPKVLDDKIKYEFVDAIVKEESEDNNYEFINVKSELYNDALNGTDNDEESTSKISPESTEKQSQNCNECHKSFKCSTHTGEKPFKCDACDKAFSKKYHLVEHKRFHTGEKPYKCDVCDKTFTRRTSIMEHKRCHTGEKPYKCDICNKTFSNSSNFVKHKRCHTGDKPFKCDVCDKSFSRNSNLLKHKRCHTGEKPFKCDKCNKTFSVKYSLVAHNLLHTGEKPFKCDICNKTFTKKHTLKRHNYSHTGEKRFKCDICVKKFSLKHNFLAHKCSHMD